MKAYLKTHADTLIFLRAPAKLLLSMMFLMLPSLMFSQSSVFAVITFTLFIYFFRSFCIEIGIKSTHWLLESVAGFILMAVSSLAIVNLASYENPLWDLAGIPVALLGAAFFYIWRVMCTDVDKFRFGLSGIFVVVMLNAFFFSSETTSMFLFATSTLPITFGLLFLFLGWAIDLLKVIGSTTWLVVSSFWTRIELSKEITPDATLS